MRLSNQEKVEIVLIVGNNYRTFRDAAEEFNANHPERENITHSTVARIMAKFKACSPKFFKFNDVARNEERNDSEDELDVLLHVREHPRLSLNQRHLDLGFNVNFIRKVLKKHHYKPFKPKFIHSLLPRDKDIRLDFCFWMMGHFEDDRNLPKKILFSDEATFTTNGIFSSQNSRYWSTENPHWAVECRSQTSEKINVWCGIVGNMILGPVFFDVNLNGNIFLNFLQTEFMELIEDLPLATRHALIFQLDGAPCHFSAQVREWLNVNFTNKWIGRATNNDNQLTNWPARSPDLSPLDYYLWGRLKEIVYKDRPANANELRNRITHACNELQGPEIENAVRRFRKNLIKCIENNGGSAEAT